MKETSILIDKPKREKPKTVRTAENIDAVTESVREASLTSIHRCSQRLVWRHTKSNWFRNWCQLTIQCVFALLSGPAIDLQKMAFLDFLVYDFNFWMLTCIFWLIIRMFSVYDWQFFVNDLDFLYSSKK